MHLQIHWCSPGEGNDFRSDCQRSHSQFQGLLRLENSLSWRKKKAWLRKKSNGGKAWEKKAIEIRGNSIKGTIGKRNIEILRRSQ